MELFDKEAIEQMRCPECGAKLKFEADRADCANDECEFFIELIY